MLEFLSELNMTNPTEFLCSLMERRGTVEGEILSFF